MNSCKCFGDSSLLSHRCHVPVLKFFASSVTESDLDSIRPVGEKLYVWKSMHSETFDHVAFVKIEEDGFWLDAWMDHDFLPDLEEVHPTHRENFEYYHILIASQNFLRTWSWSAASFKNPELSVEKLNERYRGYALPFDLHEQADLNSDSWMTETYLNSTSNPDAHKEERQKKVIDDVQNFIIDKVDRFLAHPPNKHVQLVQHVKSNDNYDDLPPPLTKDNVHQRLTGIMLNLGVGLGKTKLSLELCQHIFPDCKVIIVGDKRIEQTFLDTFEKFTDLEHGLWKKLGVDKSSNITDETILQYKFFYISSSNIVNVKDEFLSSQIQSLFQSFLRLNQQFVLIVDEVQHILGKRRLYKQVKSMVLHKTCRCRILLSATPIANANRTDFSVLSQILFCEAEKPLYTLQCNAEKARVHIQSPTNGNHALIFHLKSRMYTFPFEIHYRYIVEYDREEEDEIQRVTSQQSKIVFQSYLMFVSALANSLKTNDDVTTPDFDVYVDADMMQTAQFIKKIVRVSSKFDDNIVKYHWFHTAVANAVREYDPGHSIPDISVPTTVETLAEIMIALDALLRRYDWKASQFYASKTFQYDPFYSISTKASLSKARKNEATSLKMTTQLVHEKVLLNELPICVHDVNLELGTDVLYDQYFLDEHMSIRKCNIAIHTSKTSIIRRTDGTVETFKTFSDLQQAFAAGDIDILLFSRAIREGTEIKCPHRPVRHLIHTSQSSWIPSHIEQVNGRVVRLDSHPQKYATIEIHYIKAVFQGQASQRYMDLESLPAAELTPDYKKERNSYEHAAKLGLTKACLASFSVF